MDSYIIITGAAECTFSLEKAQRQDELEYFITRYPSPNDHIHWLHALTTPTRPKCHLYKKEMTLGASGCDQCVELVGVVTGSSGCSQ